MKTIKFIFSVLAVFIFSIGVMAQPPDPPGGHGSDDDELPGGDAPIGGGTFVLMGLAVAYGGKKVFNLLKQDDKN